MCQNKPCTFLSQTVVAEVGPVFLLVTATCLFDLPSSMVSMTSSGLQTNLSVQPFKKQNKKKKTQKGQKEGKRNVLT